VLDEAGAQIRQFQERFTNDENYLWNPLFVTDAFEQTKLSKEFVTKN
jgi:hypothetical protein